MELKLNKLFCKFKTRAFVIAVSLCAPLHDDEKVSLAAGEADSAAGRTALQPSCTRRAQPHPGVQVAAVLIARRAGGIAPCLRS